MYAEREAVRRGNKLLQFQQANPYQYDGLH